MFNRIMIIGSPGSGKSTLSTDLSKALKLPVIHLDKLFWTNGWTEVSSKAFDEKLNKELEKPQWIMDGNYSRTVPLRLKYADAVIFLDYPTLLCLFRAVKRIVLNYGKVRPDMGDGCPERFDFEFLRYILTFRRSQRRKLYTLLENSDVRVFIIKNRRDLNMLRAQLTAHL